MKRTLLEMVKGILNDTDGEAIDSIDDLEEARMIASVIQDTYYAMVSTGNIPETVKQVDLVAASNSLTPTTFIIPEHVKKISDIQYDVSPDADPRQFRTLKYKEPREFMKLNFKGTWIEDYKIYVRDDKQPNYFTTFDDRVLVLDSFDSTVDNTLQAHKTKAMAAMFPPWSMDDDFVPLIDDNALIILYEDAKATYQSLFKGGPDPKIEMRVRRLRALSQNDMDALKFPNKRVRYGRR